MNLETVDIISTDLSGNVVLTISDELVWDDNNEHLLALQKKINLYLSFIESGNIYQEYPDGKGRNAIISLVAKYKPNDIAILFLNKAKETLHQAGYGFNFKVLTDPASS